MAAVTCRRACGPNALRLCETNADCAAGQRCRPIALPGVSVCF
jgi:hypothetical protein